MSLVDRNRECDRCKTAVKLQSHLNTGWVPGDYIRVYIHIAEDGKEVQVSPNLLLCSVRGSYTHDCDLSASDYRTKNVAHTVSSIVVQTKQIFLFYGRECVSREKGRKSSITHQPPATFLKPFPICFLWYHTNRGQCYLSIKTSGITVQGILYYPESISNITVKLTLNVTFDMIFVMSPLISHWSNYKLVFPAFQAYQNMKLCLTTWTLWIRWLNYMLFPTIF